MHALLKLLQIQWLEHPETYGRCGELILLILGIKERGGLASHILNLIRDSGKLDSGIPSLTLGAVEEYIHAFLISC
jgi:hypothetical protein